jgi:hypothetical protein
MRNSVYVVLILFGVSIVGLECTQVQRENEFDLADKEFKARQIKLLQDQMNEKERELAVNATTKKNCEAGNRRDCEKVLWVSERHELTEGIIFATSKLCAESDDIQLDSCYKLVSAATAQNNIAMIEQGARIGCKYLEGRLCSLLFSLQKAKGNKEIALKILPLAVTLTKDECEHGFSDSCSEAEQLSAKCYADSKDCKELKLYLKKTQIDAKTKQEQLAREEQFKKKIISLEEQKIENARRAEERRVWSDLANELGKNLSKAGNSYGNNRIRCTSNTWAGTTFTNCD